MGLLDEQAVINGLLGLSNRLRGAGKGILGNVQNFAADPLGTMNQALNNQVAPFREVDAIAGSDATRSVRRNQMAEAALGMAGPSAAGTFAGVTAKTADLAKKAQAEKSLSAGVAPAEVWKETGWFKGYDGKLRSEINDANARLTKIFDDMNWSSGDVRNWDTRKLGEILDHPDLYKAYPHLPDISVARGNFGNAYGIFDENKNIIGMGYGADLPGLLHEVQHAIQRKEGFAYGGSPKDLGYDQYRRIAGEVEARNVEARSGFNELYRREIPPINALEELVSVFGKKRPKYGATADIKDADVLLP